jgi:hypothetical protein
VYQICDQTEITILSYIKIKRPEKKEISFPYLANIAKRYLGIQASSAAVEKMFFISGQIFSLKIRRLGEVIFSDQVYLKQRSVIAQKLLLQLLLNFQCPITITKLFFVKKRPITITLARLLQYYFKF